MTNQDTKVSIILPTRKRPQNLKRAIENFHRTETPFELVIVLDSDDEDSQKLVESFAFPNLVTLILPSDLLGVGKFNKGARRASGNWLVLAADDITFPENWLETALETPNKGFIGFIDRHQNGFATHYLVTKNWLKKYQGGVFVVPHYYHWGVDVEASLRAQRSGTFVLSNVEIEHHHYLWDKTVPEDETYLRGKKHYEQDIALLNDRMKRGFPNDFVGYL